MNGPTEQCPKSMIYGPCGGVGPDGACEVGAQPCTFLDQPPPRWVGPVLDPRPVDLGPVIVDLRPEIGASEFRASIETLAQARATGLIGDHLDEPTESSTIEQVRAVSELGLPVIATVACRGKSSAQAEDRLGRLRDAGAAVLLCVTGDHPRARNLDVEPQRFELDSVRLVAMARRLGLLVAVAESPASPPIADRPSRLATKERAGADLAILNHGGSTTDLIGFARRARRAGVTLPLVAPVPVITSPATLRALTQFPGLHLSPEIHAIVGAVQPRQVGIATAGHVASQLLQSEHIAHVNLSGRATDHGQLDRARIMAGIAETIQNP